jgi:hypothetical protein
VGDKKQIEAKSRKQRLQLETILNWAVPDEHIIQVQTGLLVTERDTLDYISYFIDHWALIAICIPWLMGWSYYRDEGVQTPK